MAASSVRIPVVEPDFARSADKPITLSHWTKKVGQRVEDGVRIVDLICDKADFELDRALELEGRAGDRVDHALTDARSHVMLHT